MSDIGTETGPGRALRLVRETFHEWVADDAIQWGAATAYYTVVSLAPLVVLAVSALGQVVDDELARRWILDQVYVLVGPQAVDVAGAVLEEAGRLELASLGAVLTLLLLVFGATAVFANLQRALNQIWGVKLRAGALRNLVRNRVAAFGAVVALGGLVILSVILGSILVWMRPVFSSVEAYFPLLQLAEFLSSLAVLWVAVGAVFWVLPDVRMSWRDVWIGALVTAVLLVAGKLALSGLVGLSASASMYGAAGAIFLLLLWVYYSAQVFFLGAEFTKVWARARDREFTPESYAAWIRPRAEGSDGLDETD